ncbi:MAG: ribonuclease P protein component [Planctomycetota bacterium]|jgi:ribonuclease P protein component
MAECSFSFPRSSRLIRAYEFKRVYGRGRRIRGETMTLVAFKRRSSGMRLGLSVSKDHGCAVRRNKIKRLLREAFRLERPQLPGRYDLITIPTKREGKYRLDELRQDFVDLLRRLESGAGRAPGRRASSRKRRRKT